MSPVQMAVMGTLKPDQQTRSCQQEQIHTDKDRCTTSQTAQNTKQPQFYQDSETTCTFLTGQNDI